MKQHETKRSSFSGKIGFVLSAAGASVGLGNIWRFPYLAAKYGGGIFLVIYIILALTFGYTMIIAETSLGRMTRKSPVGVYASFGKSKWILAGGWINAVIPILIVPYYSVIGGWVIKYLVSYATGETQLVAADGYFSEFISDGVSTEIYFVVFALIVLAIIYAGVRNGIERVSKFMMPVLVILSLIITVYSVTRPGALAGVKYFLVPNVSNFSWMTVVTAMGQMFYSLSIAMGILITFGSYMKRETSIEESTKQVEIFDTAIAMMAGLMIIPAVFVFSGTEGMASGPSLMFVSLPKVFNSMGRAGALIGLVFFIMVAFAALTSCISIMETLVANCMELFHKSRQQMSLLIGILFAGAAAVICMGYNIFYFEMPLPNGQTAQLLDLMDYISNSFLMPFISLLTCIFVGWVIKPAWIDEEMEVNGNVFRRKKMYAFMIRYVTPIMMAVLFLQSAGIFTMIRGLFCPI